MKLRFLPAGDTGLVVEFGDTVDRELNDGVLSLKASVDVAQFPGIVETVPTFRSLLIRYDPLVTRGSDLEAEIQALNVRNSSPLREARLWRLPACYDRESAPDLDEVGKRAGIGADGVIALHTSVQFHVYMMGFTPGFPYMGDLPAQLRLPRRTDPRQRVPLGSIAIATSMTAIYPIESPGGWHLIGRCPIRLFDPSRPQPALLAPGDAVRFERVSLSTFEAISRKVQDETFELKPQNIMMER